MLAEELKHKFMNKESHGHSLNDKDCRRANLLRKLAQPLQQPYTSEEPKYRSIVTDSEAEVTGALGKERDKSCELSGALQLLQVQADNGAAKSATIKSDLPPSLQKLEDARIADVHEGANSFKSLLAGRA